jgi:hypothetical protein
MDAEGSENQPAPVETRLMAKESSEPRNPINPAEQLDAIPQRTVHCKQYHSPRTAGNPGMTRRKSDRKSQCPSWAANVSLQRALIAEALEDTGKTKDCRGRPKRLWNAVEKTIFIAVSCNLNEPMYNCYPEVPPDGKLLSELLRRAERTLDDIPR